MRLDSAERVGRVALADNVAVALSPVATGREALVELVAFDWTSEDAAEAIWEVSEAKVEFDEEVALRPVGSVDDEEAVSVALRVELRLCEGQKGQLARDEEAEQ